MEQQHQSGFGETEPKAPILCENNCGFFGSTATNNLCSKCYKDFISKQQKALVDAPVVENKGDYFHKVLENLGQVGEVQEAEPRQVEEGTTSGDPEKNSISNRCGVCPKKVGLTGFKCRCGHTFCSLHRYSDKHNCVFDYKSAGQDAIAKANPVVKADKIEKI